MKLKKNLNLALDEFINLSLYSEKFGYYIQFRIEKTNTLYQSLNIDLKSVWLFTMNGVLSDILCVIVGRFLQVL